MHFQSARHFLGKPVVSKEGDTPFGLIESITLDPSTMLVDGFLIGRADNGGAQDFLPRECIIEASGDHLLIHKTLKKPAKTTRILGLQAWTTKPKFLVGFVYDLYFSLNDGQVESFIVHQLIRTWRIPTSSIEQITPKALLINNDTTIKLKITPYVTPGAM